MPHVAFTLDQHLTLQAFPMAHRLALRSRIVLDVEEAEEVAELYARDPHDVAYTLAAAPGGMVEVSCWPAGLWQAFTKLDAALAWVIEREAEAERKALGEKPAGH